MKFAGVLLALSLGIAVILLVATAGLYHAQHSAIEALPLTSGEN